MIGVSRRLYGRYWKTEDRFEGFGGVDGDDLAPRLEWFRGLGVPGRGVWLTGVGRRRLVPVAEDGGPGLLDAVIASALHHSKFGEHPRVTALGGQTPAELRLGLVETFDALMSSGHAVLMSMVSRDGRTPTRVRAAFLGGQGWDDLVSEVAAFLVAERFEVGVRIVDSSGQLNLIGGGPATVALVVFRESTDGVERFSGTEPNPELSLLPSGVKSHDEADDAAMAGPAHKQVQLDPQLFGGESPMTELSDSAAMSDVEEVRPLRQVRFEAEDERIEDVEHVAEDEDEDEAGDADVLAGENDDVNAIDDHDMDDNDNDRSVQEILVPPQRVRRKMHVPAERR